MAEPHNLLCLFYTLFVSHTLIPFDFPLMMSSSLAGFLLKTQKWVDYQLRWDEADYGGISVLRLPPDKVCQPFPCHSHVPCHSIATFLSFSYKFLFRIPFFFLSSKLQVGALIQFISFSLVLTGVEA